MDIRNLSRTVLAVLIIGAAWAQDGVAQTPEGTVITNTATVSWTDANSNTYTPVNAQVSVTVGFSAGIDAIAQAASVTPASPSTGDTIAFWVKNLGNGWDSLIVAESISNGAVMTVTGFRYSATAYGSLAALNTALSADSVAAGDSVEVQVIYDVPAGQGGESTVYTLTATSRRDGGATDNDATTVSPPSTYAVDVTPDGGQNIERLPSNGTNYTFQFTVQNTGNSAEDFDLLATSPGSAVITIVSVDGIAGDSTRLNIGSGSSVPIDVVYSVGNAAAGSTDTLQLRARSVPDNPTFDDGFADLTVIRATITMTKEVFRDDQVTPIGAGTVIPGEYIQYKITVTNAGDGNAVNVHIDDMVPGDLTVDSTSPDAAGWTLANAGNDIDADLSGTLAPAASRFFWVRVLVN